MADQPEPERASQSPESRQGDSNTAEPGEAAPAAPSERRGLPASLFEIAGRLRSNLAPIEPPPAFVADLKRQLIANAGHARDVAQRKRKEKRQAVIAIGAGGAVYVLGLVAVALRAGLALAGLVATLARRRRRDLVHDREASETT
jgi:hypothetical protein